MDIVVLKRDEVPVALGALKTVALADGSLAPTERELLEVLGSLHGVTVDVDALPLVGPAEVASAITDPHRRKRVLQMALVTALADGEVTKDEEVAVRELSTALDVSEQALGVLHDVARDHRMMVRIDLGRRLGGRFMSEAWKEEGFAGLGKMLTTVLGTENPEVAWRYRELGLLPEGTFGRAMWEHCTRRHFAMPGEKGGLPERMVFHDLGHVLAGYDTDPDGEIQQGAFQAGFMRTDGFAFLLFVLVQFHIGIRATPIAKAETGYFQPKKVLRALERGAACRVDLGDHWDFWELMPVPLDEVRARLGIPPM